MHREKHCCVKMIGESRVPGCERAEDVKNGVLTPLVGNGGQFAEIWTEAFLLPTKQHYMDHPP